MQLEKYMEKLKLKGYKKTPQRRAIINALLKSKGPTSARDVLAAVQQEFPGLSLDTVYRNLHLLAQMGILHQIDLRSAESSKFEIGGGHHHHLVCIGCGRSVCLEGCLVDASFLSRAEEHGFQLVGHAFELYGYCAGCQKLGMGVSK
ncbi:MAG: transcriptional repressor [Syntrophomonadaceae bacterium]|nr:transcriptional repressor [Syntrophomonadaceae bacterium]